VHAVKGRWILAGSIAAILLAGAWWRGPRMLARALGPRAISAMAVTAPRHLARATPSPVTAPPPDSPGSEAGPAVTREVFFEQYADEVCLCPDMACVGEVDRRYNHQIGRTRGMTNKQAIDAARLRMHDCEQQIADSG
jgi:hypothetical protein